MSGTTPLVLFSMKPLTQRAKAAVDDPRNKHLISFIFESQDRTIRAIDVGCSRPSSSSTLATLGRNADITLDDPTISRHQCSFEIIPESNAVMLYDMSGAHSTDMLGDRDLRIHDGHLPRRILLFPGQSTIIGMGGKRKDLFKFSLHWHYEHDNLDTFFKLRKHLVPAKEPSHLIRTTDTTPTNQLSDPYYFKMGCLGKGVFGSVYKGIEVHTGQLVAVKTMKAPDRPDVERWSRTLDREVTILRGLNLPKIVEYVHHQGDLNEFELVMKLKEGSLFSLCQDPHWSNELIHTVLDHILQALDFLSSKNIIHRDVKPENILYTSTQRSFTFQLGDFGLSHNDPSVARMQVGTGLYLAPKIVMGGRQTPKADIYSLFVTLIYIHDLGGSRQNMSYFSNIRSAQNFVQGALDGPDIAYARDMAPFDPEFRASAAQMLAKLSNESGLTTPLSSTTQLNGQLPSCEKDVEMRDF